MTNAEFQRMFPNHYAGVYRLQGRTRALTRDVVVVVTYINDAVSRWDEDGIRRHNEEYEKGLQHLRDQAARHGVTLDLQLRAWTVSIDETVPKENFYAVAPAVVKAIGYYQSMAHMLEVLKEQFGCKEVAMVFAVNRPMWPCAMTASTAAPYLDECAFMDDRLDARAFAHELLHLFGAVDQFYPDNVLTASRRILPQSIMCDGWEIDSLTRFLIGWDDTPDAAAMRFICATADVTYERYCEALSRFWKDNIL